MTLTAGTRLGPYEVLSPLGAGGMGEVYRARDTRLGRDVALKVLPAALASDPERLKRLETEARTASALNHPNILTVHDIGSADSISYIAMEFVDGPTLAELVARGPLPLKKLLDIAEQIADGLASAHEVGVIHRDLKPGNIMISREGFAKILDFGLAKVQSLPKSPAVDTHARTFSVPKTLPGYIVGTTAYMSPEQARGEAIDFRSDQFALGSVLYEMATGRLAFSGRSDVDTLLAILQKEPEPVKQARLDVPPPLTWIIERCLAKESGDRFVSTRDLARDLASVGAHLAEMGNSTEKVEPVRGSRWRRPAFREPIAWVVAGLSALAAVLLFVSPRRAAAPGRPLRLSLLPPETAAFNFSSSSPAPIAVSPDGSRVVFGVRDAAGQDLLWVRPLNGVSAEALPGTEGATYPFWSPDGRSIGFFADGKLRRIEASGGPAETLCDAPNGRGGTWNDQGVILFAPDDGGPLFRVSASGGTPAPVTPVDASKPSATHRWPQFLPDGRHFLFLGWTTAGGPSEGDGISVGSLDGKAPHLLVRDISNALYASSGFLLYVREGTLIANAFDAASLQLRGPPVPLVEQISYHPYRRMGIFSVSNTGILVYQAGAMLEESQLLWFDRAGARSASPGPPGHYSGIRLAPDGRRCAVEIVDPRTGAIDIWIEDLARGVLTRLTAGERINDSPVWSPDGGQIVFAANKAGHSDLFRKTANGSGNDEPVLVSGDDKAPTDWSPDGRLIVFDRVGPGKRDRREVWILSMPNGQPSPILQTAFNEWGGRFSPDGRWLAYCSDNSGRSEVYVRAFPERGDGWRVSVNGGSQPVWRRDGQELFYVSADQRLMAVRTKDVSSLEPSAIENLFGIRMRSSASDIALYDVSADGRRFLVNSATEPQAPSPVTVVVDWPALLRR
jgi:eukaryotic-like serine/threonine-protein kinase